MQRNQSRKIVIPRNFVCKFCTNVNFPERPMATYDHGNYNVYTRTQKMLKIFYVYKILWCKILKLLLRYTISSLGFPSFSVSAVILNTSLSSLFQNSMHSKWNHYVTKQISVSLRLQFACSSFLHNEWHVTNPLDMLGLIIKLYTYHIFK